MDSALWGYLTRLDESGALELGEETIDVELAGHNASPGALVLTDRRVVFFRSSPVRRRESLLAVSLSQITSVEASERRSPLRKKGVLRIRCTTAQDEETEYIFEHIPGGLLRADELSRIVSLQRAHLLRGEGGVSTELRPYRPESVDPTTADKAHPTIIVGRGVTSHVRKHGGRLFVWGEPIGGFEWIKASTNRPTGVDFTYVGNVHGFDLYVQDTIPGAQRLRLGRRWLPRPRIVVDTGLAVG
jgi:hypothetical protein